VPDASAWVLLGLHGMPPVAAQRHETLRARRDGTPAILEDRYHLGARLGQGACGVVYEARATDAAAADHGKRRVAIKVLAERQVGDLDAIARFTHEAFLSSKLRHANLVRVLDFGWITPDRPYYAMDLLEGATLDRVLAEVGRLSPARALALVEDAAKALAVLHRYGIVHRDVKPSNIFVTVGKGRRRPRARLIDLGVAGVFDARKAKKLGSVNVGARGSYGTPAYIAPEQILRQPTDQRADVYGLACVTYRALTGFDPFRAATITETVQAHLFEEVRPPSRLNPALPAAVDAVLTRAMAKDRDERTPTVGRFVAELRAALADA
jgi:eukaryotic-like serine/threonine-protein kinase